MKKKLGDILKPYDNWFNNSGEEKNKQAREVLYIFYAEFKKYKPSKTYENRNGLHTSYIRFLVAIKKAFMEEKYMRVCNELYSLIHYEPFLQNRIYFNIINILEI